MTNILHNIYNKIVKAKGPDNRNENHHTNGGVRIEAEEVYIHGAAGRVAV